MTESVTRQVRLPDDKPPAWANSLMKWALSTPGIQSMVGTAVALLTFTGRHSGKTYTIPVSYHRENDIVTVITKRQRNWWRNFMEPTEVGLRLAGDTFVGAPEIVVDDHETLEFMIDYLEKRPVDAKAYGLKPREFTRDDVAAIMPHIVVIRIHLMSAE